MAKKEAKLDYEWKPGYGWVAASRIFFGIVFRTLWPLTIKGREHVPREGAAIIVSNHLSMIDPFVVGYAARRLVSYMGKSELFGVPFVGFYLRQLGGFPVDRSRRDAASLRTALTVLKNGELLGMFPEGTRSSTGELQELRAGAARLAARTRSPIIPMAVHNTNRALPPGKLPRPARISLTIGPPFELTELYDRNDKGEGMERAIATIKERIEALGRE